MQLCSINTISVEAEKKNDISKPISQASTAVKTVTPAQNTNSTVAQTPVVPAINTTPVATLNTQNTANTTSIPSVQTGFKKPILKTSTPSINQRFNTEKKTDNPEEKEASFLDTERPKDALNQQKIDAAWLRYTSELKAKGKQNLAIVLTSRQPVLAADNLTIDYTINNKATEESLNEDKTNFLSFLRKELNNYSVQLNIVVAQLEEGKNLYTATDRYKHLSEKNPTINKLRQAFDLDIEF
jgi:DNA polymerase-3 subunit gamma/tau